MSNFGKKFHVTGGANLVQTWMSPRVATSVQYGSITLAAAAATNTATITAIDPNRTVVLWLGQSYTAANDDTNALSRVTLTNATTVTASRLATAFEAVVSFVVLQFGPGVLKSTVQRGVITITAPASSSTATITAVSLSRAVVFFGGSTAITGADAANYFARTTLTNATTVTTTRIGNTGDLEVNWQVAEFW